MDAYNIADIFGDIEIQLLKNLTGTLADGGWRADRVRAYQEFKRRNQDIIFSEPLSDKVQSELEESYKNAGYKTQLDMKKHSLKYQGQRRFTVNDRKLKALIKELQGTTRKAQVACLRQTNDRFRRSMAKVNTLFATNLYTLNECVDIATKDFLAAGVNSIRYKNGKNVNITSYAEMAMRSANRRATLYAEGAARVEYGVFTVLISQYGACSKTCLPWQGKVYFDDVYAGGNPKDNKDNYLLLSTAIDGGLFHPNCRHKSSTFYPDINEVPPQMDETEVKRNAELESEQRYNERQIRKWKRMQEASVTDESKKLYGRKVRTWQEKQRNLIKANPSILRRDYPREKTWNVPLDKSKIDDIITLSKKDRLAFARMDYSPELDGKISNLAVREWYVEHDKRIPRMIDKKAPVEDQARQAFDLRNKYKLEARNMMRDQAERAELDAATPLTSFEEFIQSKMERKGLTRSEALADTVKTSTKTNKKVNNTLGVEG